MTKSPSRVLPDMPDLRHQHAIAADLNVVPDLDQIVDHGAGADDGIRAGTAVERGVGANFHIVADDDAAQLRHFDEAIGIGRKTETVLSDTHAGIEPDARTDNGVADRDLGAHPRVVAERTCSTDYAAGTDQCATTDFGPRAYHGERLDPTAFADLCAGVDASVGRNPRDRRRLWIKGLRRQRVSAVGSLRHQQA